MIFDTLIYFAAINIACTSFDGWTSMLDYPNFDGSARIIGPETGPAKYLVGEYPTWQDYLIAGISELVILSTISYCLKKSRMKKYWYIPQLSISIMHLGFGINNLYNYQKWMHEGREKGYIE